MDESSQLHAPAATRQGEEPPVTMVYDAGWAPELDWTLWRIEKYSSCQESNPGRRSSSPSLYLFHIVRLQKSPNTVKYIKQQTNTVSNIPTLLTVYVQAMLYVAIYSSARCEIWTHPSSLLGIQRMTSIRTSWWNSSWSYAVSLGDENQKLMVRNDYGTQFGCRGCNTTDGTPTILNDTVSKSKRWSCHLVTETWSKANIPDLLTRWACVVNFKFWPFHIRHCKGDREDTTADMEVVASAFNVNPTLSVQTVTSHFSDWANPAYVN